MVDMNRITMEEEINERPDSIKVSRGVNNKFSFEIKRYYDFGKDEPNLVIRSIEKIYEELKQTFELEEKKPDEEDKAGINKAQLVNEYNKWGVKWTNKNFLKA